MDVGNSLPGNPLLRIPWIAQMKRMKGDLPLQLDQIQSWTVVRLNCSQKDVTEIYDWTILDLHWWLVLLEAMCRKNDPKILVRLTFKRNTSSTTKHLPNPPFESLASIDEGKPKKTRRIEPSTSPKVVVTEVEKVDRGPSVACFWMMRWWCLSRLGGNGRRDTAPPLKFNEWPLKRDHLKNIITTVDGSEIPRPTTGWDGAKNPS